MANVLILGGGFGGVVAAETLVTNLSHEHQVTLVSRDDRFLFYPALVRLAFGECEIADISFDLRKAMMDRRVRFIKAEVARISPSDRHVTLTHGEVEGELPYDYLIFALGRRLATEKVTGFYEHAHHLLTPEAALKFGEAVASFHEGHAIIGNCAEAKLPIPVFETAFALSRRLQERGERGGCRITVINPNMASLEEFGGRELATKLYRTLEEHGIEYVADFPVSEVTAQEVRTFDGHILAYDLLMLLPPFAGVGPVIDTGITDSKNFIRVDDSMRVIDAERMYAVGDSTNLRGAKTAHMSVRQAEVAAANAQAEIEGRTPSAKYEHEIRSVIDEGGRDSIYLHKKLWTDEIGDVSQGRVWRWAKLAQEKTWMLTHS
ncbi:MAG: FAD-dependent oxidoreductase [Pyrinomonadaceae bacterium]